MSRVETTGEAATSTRCFPVFPCTASSLILVVCLCVFTRKAADRQKQRSALHCFHQNVAPQRGMKNSPENDFLSLASGTNSEGTPWCRPTALSSPLRIAASCQFPCGSPAVIKNRFREVPA